MNDATLKLLGKLVEGNPPRDAVHVAVVPVEAGVALEPGQHVGLSSDGTATPTRPHIGIVDPLLTARVQPGQRFWLWLYPGTITSLVHHWTHPAFDQPQALKDYTGHLQRLLGQTGTKGGR